MAEIPTSGVRTWRNWLTMFVGGGVGYGVSMAMIRLGARIRDLLEKWNIKSGKNTMVGVAAAVVIYLGLILYGWKKPGIVGDFMVGFGIGSIADELLNSGVV